MTYMIRKKTPTRIITLNADGNQTGASDGDKVLFPTKITSGGDSVSISNGVITLSSSRDYYISVHVDAIRSAGNLDIAFEWYNNTTNTKLTRSDGAFEARYLPTTSALPGRDGCDFGQLILEQPTFDISVRLNRLGSNTASINVGCHLFILEFERG